MAIKQCGDFNMADMLNIRDALERERLEAKNTTTEISNIFDGIKERKESPAIIKIWSDTLSDVKELQRKRIIDIKDTEKKVLECTSALMGLL